MAEGVRIEPVKVADIKVGERTRAVSEEAIAVLKASHADQGGFTTPIHVRKTKTGYELIDGAHRLELAKRLDLDEIVARIWTCSKQQARFLEVDANVSQADLTPVALARSLAIRHEAYVKLHPETAAGMAGGLARQGQQGKNSSFAEFVAEARGLTKRRVRQIIQAGRNLTAKEASILEQAPRRVSIDDLSEMAKIADDDERAHVVLSLSSGNEKSAAAARKAWAAETGSAPAKPSDADRAYKALCDAWSRAPKRVQDMFLGKYHDDLSARLDALSLDEGDDHD